MKSCLLCGVGGQGTVLASRVLAQAAMEQGLMARTAETIGMAQRGGCVVSHVRIGDGSHSSLIPLGGADLVVAFEPGEAVRCLPYLAPGGTVIVSPQAVQPVTAALTGKRLDGEVMINYLKSKVENLIIIDTDAICRQCGSSKIVNTALLGAVAQCGVMGLTYDQIKNVLIKKIKPQFIELNEKALDLGAKFAMEAAEK